jgi:hypothetical protein
MENQNEEVLDKNNDGRISDYEAFLSSLTKEDKRNLFLTRWVIRRRMAIFALIFGTIIFPLFCLLAVYLLEDKGISLLNIISEPIYWLVILLDLAYIGLVTLDDMKTMNGTFFKK